MILQAWNNRDLLNDPEYSGAVKAVIEEVDKGRLRTAEPLEEGWQVNEWVKQAILLYFGVQQCKPGSCLHLNFMIKCCLKIITGPWV